MRKALFIWAFCSFLFLSCGRASNDALSEKIHGLEELSELGTVEYTINKIIKADDATWYKYGERKILFSCTAFLKAGIDMKDFKAEDVIIDKSSKSITVSLPKAKLLSYNIPPEMIHQEFCSVTGFRFDFSPQDKQDLKVQGEQSIIEDIPGYGILEDAEKNAKLFFEAMFSQFGYETIVVNFK